MINVIPVAINHCIGQSDGNSNLRYRKILSLDLYFVTFANDKLAKYNFCEHSYLSMILSIAN